MQTHLLELHFSAVFRVLFRVLYSSSRGDSVGSSGVGMDEREFVPLSQRRFITEFVCLHRRRVHKVGRHGGQWLCAASLRVFDSSPRRRGRSRHIVFPSFSLYCGVFSGLSLRSMSITVRMTLQGSVSSGIMVSGMLTASRGLAPLCSWLPQLSRHTNPANATRNTTPKRTQLNSAGIVSVIFLPRCSPHLGTRSSARCRRRRRGLGLLCVLHSFSSGCCVIGESSCIMCRHQRWPFGRTHRPL